MATRLASADRILYDIVTEGARDRHYALSVWRAITVVLGLTLSSSVCHVALAGTISGEVTTIWNGNVERIPGASVTLSGPAILGTRMTTTDSRGRYRFVGVPPGKEYRLVAELTGFFSWPMTVEYLFFDDRVVANLPLDITSLGCTLGRPWQIPQALSPPGVFRLRQ